MAYRGGGANQGCFRRVYVKFSGGGVLVFIGNWSDRVQLIRDSFQSEDYWNTLRLFINVVL